MASARGNDESKIRERDYGVTKIQEKSVDCLRPDPYRLVINFQISTPVCSPRELPPSDPRYDIKEKFQLPTFVSYVLTYI